MLVNKDAFCGGLDSLLNESKGIKSDCESPSSISSSSEESDIDVVSFLSTVDASESDVLSEALDGSYSCFRGEEDLLDFTRLDSRIGVLDFLMRIGLCSLCLGVGGDCDSSTVSLFVDERLFFTSLEDFGVCCFTAGVDHTGSSSGSMIGVVGGLSLRALGMYGRSIEGTEDVER